MTFECMKNMVGTRSGRCLALSAVAALGVSVQAGTLSGKVLSPDSTALAGVKVALVGSEKANAVSAADGSWSLSTSTVGIRGARPGAASGAKGAVQLQDGHLKLSLQGADAAGRNASKSLAATSRAEAFGRSTSVPDTLVYSVGDSVVLRDTITVLDQSGILRIIDTTINAAVTYGYLTDSRDGHWYRTVQIGSQTWMAQNLNYAIDSSWALDTALRFGRLYNWTGAVGLKDSCKNSMCAFKLEAKPQGVCPTGWHVPSDSSFGVLLKLVEADARVGSGKGGSALKLTSGWSSDNGKDLFGFGLLPTGYRDQFGGFNSPKYSVYLLTSKEYASSTFTGEYFGYSNSDVQTKNYNKSWGVPVRCLKN